MRLDSGDRLPKGRHGCSKVSSGNTGFSATNRLQAESNRVEVGRVSLKGVARLSLKEVGRVGGDPMLNCEKFSVAEVASLRNELLTKGLDSWQAAELFHMFLAGRGYGISSSE